MYQVIIFLRIFDKVVQHVCAKVLASPDYSFETEEVGKQKASVAVDPVLPDHTDHWPENETYQALDSRLAGVSIRKGELKELVWSDNDETYIFDAEYILALFGAGIEVTVSKKNPNKAAVLTHGGQRVGLLIPITIT